MKGIRQTFPTSERSNFFLQREDMNLDSFFFCIIIISAHIYYSTTFPFLPLLPNLSNQTNQAIPDTAIKYISHSCYFTAVGSFYYGFSTTSPQLVVSCYFTFTTHYTFHTPFFAISCLSASFYVLKYLFHHLHTPYSRHKSYFTGELQ